MTFCDESKTEVPRFVRLPVNESVQSMSLQLLLKFLPVDRLVIAFRSFASHWVTAYSVSRRNFGLL